MKGFNIGVIRVYIIEATAHFLEEDDILEERHTPKPVPKNKQTTDR
jgi:hypothetical protein